MKALQMILLVAAASVAFCASAWSQVTVCDGETTQICSSIVAGGSTNVTANAEEVDPISNDPLGEPTIVSDGGNAYVICVGISNDGGDLSGPNGEVQNGFGEGDCIEVQLEIFITITTTITIGPVTVTSMTVRKSTTDPVKVCPC